MEVLALRKTAGVFSEPQNLTDKPIFQQALAPSERRPRAELNGVANSYFEGMEAGTNKNTPFDKDCQRIENGVITSNHPASKSPITWADRTEHSVNRRSISRSRFSSRNCSKFPAAKSTGLKLVTPVPYGMSTGWPPRK